MSHGHNENHHFWGAENAKISENAPPRNQVRQHRTRQLPELRSCGSSDFGDSGEDFGASEEDFGDSGEEFGHSGQDFGDSGQAEWESRKLQSTD